MGEWVQAREAIEQALQMRPDDAYAKRSLDTTWPRQATTRALALLRDAHEAMPADEVAHERELQPRLGDLIFKAIEKVETVAAVREALMKPRCRRAALA